MEHDARDLHLAVKPAGDCAGQFDFSVEDVLEIVDTVPVDYCGNRSALGAHLDRDAWPVRTLNKVHAANRPAHCYQAAVEFGPNQLVKGRRYRRWQTTMTQHTDAGGGNN